MRINSSLFSSPNKLASVSDILVSETQREGLRGLRSSTRPNLRAYFLYFKPLYPLRTDSQPSQGSSLWCPRGSKTGTGRALVTFGINLNSSPAALLTRASDSAVCSSATQKPCVARHSGSGSGYYLVSSIYCALQRALAKYWDPPRSGIEQSAPPPPRKS